MKTTSKLVSLAVAGVMTAAPFGLAQAATDTQPANDTSAAANYATQNGMLKTAQDARMAVQRTHEARLAIFNDDIDSAKKLVDQALKALADSEDQFDSLALADTDEVDSTKLYLPFDLQMALAENFTATEESKAALERAYGLFESDDADQAIDVLRVASIDLQVTAAQLPAKESLVALKNAKAALDNGDYHKANQALKSVEDSIIVRTYGLDAIPAQGDNSQANAGDHAKKADNQQANAGSNKPAKLEND